MLKLQNVSKYYSRNGAVALGLRKINLTLGLGEFVAVVGESGSGKSTLLHVMCGLDTYEDGEMYINGEETSHFTAQDWENYRRTHVGFISQNFNLIDSYTVLQNVELALVLAGYDPAKRRERAQQIIERVGLTPHLHVKASKLSGGQMQRTVIARALAKDCPIIAADEPTGNLDSASSRQIIELLEEISRDRLVIVVTHNFPEVAHLATRKITIHDGEVVENRQLKPAAPVQPVPAPHERTTRVSWREAIPTAIRNLASTPLKTLLMFLVMLMLTFGSAFVYGSMQNLQDETAFSDTNPFFRNGAEERVIIKRSDNSAFPPDELERLSATPRVVALVRGDLALDQQVTVAFPYALGGGQETLRAKLMPGALADKAKLTIGRLPESDREIVINTRMLRKGIAAEDLLGRTFDYTYLTAKIPLTIVGISEERDQGEVAFVPATVLDQIAGLAMAQYQTFTYSSGQFQGIPFTPQVYVGNGTLGEQEIALPPTLAYSFCSTQQIAVASCLEQIIGKSAQLTVASLYEKHRAEYTIARVVAEAPQPERVAPERPAPERLAAKAPTIYVSQAAYDRWAARQAVYQVSLFGRNTDDARSLRSHLTAQGYKTFYPNDTIGAIPYVIRVVQFVFYAILLVVFVGIFFFITYFIMRTVMRSKKKDYVTMRSIGATYAFIKQVLFSELFLIITLTYATALLAYGLSQVVSVPVVSKLMMQLFRRYSLFDFVSIYALLAALAVLLGRRFHKKMFGDSVVSTFKGEEGE